jgi:phosphatidylglycerophosphatase A
LLFTPANWLAQGAAVALFRLFDITKPWPIRMVERRVKGGLGIMIDDLIAAVMTLFVLAVAVHYDVLPR